MCRNKIWKVQKNDNVKINQAKSSRSSKSSVASFHLMWERSGSVVECLSSNFEPHRRHCVMSLSKNINPSLELVQPRKTRPFISERLLTECKESKQTNIPPDILMCGPRGGGGGSPHPSPGKAQVIRVSIEISIWSPLEKVGPPGKCWTPSGSLEKDSFLCYKTIAPPPPPP